MSLKSPFSNKRLHEESEDDQAVAKSVWLPDIETAISGSEGEEDLDIHQPESEAETCDIEILSEYEGPEGTESVYRRIDDGLELEPAENFEKHIHQDGYKSDGEQCAPTSTRDCKKVHHPFLVTGEARKIHVPRTKVPKEEKPDDDYESFAFLLNDEHRQVVGAEEQTTSTSSIFDEISLSQHVRDELLVKAVVDEFEKTITPQIELLRSQAFKYEKLKTLLNVPSIDEIQKAIGKSSLNPLFNSDNVLLKLQNPNGTEVQQTIGRIVNDMTEESELLKGSASKLRASQTNDKVYGATPDLYSRPARKVRVQSHDAKSSSFKRHKKPLQTIEEVSFDSIIEDENDQDEESRESTKKPKIDHMIVIGYEEKKEEPLLSHISLDSDYRRSKDTRYVRELATEELKTMKARIHNGSFVDLQSKKIHKLISQFERIHIEKPTLKSYHHSHGSDNTPEEYYMKIGKMTNMQLLKCIDFELYSRICY